MKLLFTSIFISILFSCSNSYERKEYANQDNVIIGYVNLDQLLIPNDSQNWIKIINTFPAIKNCKNEINADLYLGVLDRKDTVQIIIPCATYLHKAGVKAKLLKLDNMYDQKVFFANEDGKLKEEYPVIIGDLLIPIN